MGLDQIHSLLYSVVNRALASSGCTCGQRPGHGQGAEGPADTLEGGEAGCRSKRTRCPMRTPSLRKPLIATFQPVHCNASLCCKLCSCFKFRCCKFVISFIGRCIVQLVCIFT